MPAPHVKSPVLAVLIAALTMAFPLVGEANASSIDLLLDRLHKKGMLTAQEVSEMRELAHAEKAEAERTTKQAISDSVKPAAKSAPGDMRASWKNGLVLATDDGQHAIGLTGRVHFDYRDVGHDFGTSYDRDTRSVADNFELRRAQLGIKGFIFKDIAYEVVTNAVGNSSNLIDTAWMNFGFYKPVQLRAGRFSQPVGLEELVSSNSSDFMENAYTHQLVPTKRLGSMLHGVPIKGMTYGISLFQNDFNPITNETENKTQSAGRVTVNAAELTGWNDVVLHLGGSVASGKYNVTASSSSNTAAGASTTTRATIVGFRSASRGMENVFRAQLTGTPLTTAAYGADSNNSSEVDRDLKGLELATAYGPFKLQYERIKANIDAQHVSTGSFVRGDVVTDYVSFMWNITGEPWAKAYRDGTFSGIEPRANFVPGSTWGAWQLGLRYSRYDASDVVVGGTAGAREQNSDKGKTWTFGLNWLLNPNARIMLNYSRTKYDVPVAPIDSGLSPSDTERMVSLRGQINF